jgi:hypothetical protein
MTGKATNPIIERHAAVAETIVVSAARVKTPAMKAFVCHSKTPTLCRNHRKARSNRNARLLLNAQASAGLENTRQLQDSEHIARWCQLFQPNFPALISGLLALRRYFSRTESDTENFWVCSLASPNRVEKSRRKTRGFTSCCIDFNFDEQYSEGLFKFGEGHQERS